MPIRDAARCCRPTGGFTLVELMAALAIIVVLASIALPTVDAAWRTVRTVRTRTQFTQWLVALEQFRTEYGYVPRVDRDGRLAADVFLPTLTGRDARGRAVDATALNGNSRRIRFYVAGDSEILRGADGAAVSEMLDAFGNGQIGVLVDADGDGVIRAAELTPVLLASGNSRDGVSGSFLLPPGLVPSDGIRASVAFYSAGAGRGASEMVVSWR